MMIVSGLYLEQLLAVALNTGAETPAENLQTVDPLRNLDLSLGEDWEQSLAPKLLRRDPLHDILGGYLQVTYWLSRWPVCFLSWKTRSGKSGTRISGKTRTSYDALGNPVAASDVTFRTIKVSRCSA